MCVQSSSVLRVLQFTPFNVVCYVLHRSVSQVIHGQQLSFMTIASVESMAVSGIEGASLAWTMQGSPPQQSLHSSSVRLPVGLNTNSRHCTPRALAGCFTTTPEANYKSATPTSWRKLSGNDPSAGSPTDTLLRLLLPLNNQVWRSSVTLEASRPPGFPPKASLNHSIGSSDGRCVQRAGT